MLPLLLLVAGIALLVLSAPIPTPAQPSLPRNSPATSDRPLAVGFLREGSDFADSPYLVERMRQQLLSRPALIAALNDAGYAADQMDLSLCFTPGDMVQRMNQQEFDLVLATALVYARQQGDYQPILMSRRPGDFQMPKEGGVLRQGVVIAGRGSELFSMESISTATLRHALANSPLAVASSDSAASYVYPTLKLNQQYLLNGPGQYWFCGSESEVIKNVVAGLAPLGACREGELAALLPATPDERYYKLLFHSDQFPTDPILVREELAPARSPLGSELKLALKAFFQSESGLAVENAGGHVFDKLRRDLAQLDEINRRPQWGPPVERTPRPTPVAIPTPEPTPSPSPSPTRTPTPTASPTPSPSPTPTPTASPTPTPTPPRTATPTPTPIPRPAMPDLLVPSVADEGGPNR
jgi:ABC-type phosphate/phosphonate transport system substrate-binding protein